MNAVELKAQIFTLFKDNPTKVLSPSYVFSVLNTDRDRTYHAIYALRDTGIVKHVGLGKFILAESTDIDGYLKVDTKIPVTVRIHEARGEFGNKWFTTDEITALILAMNPGYPARDRKQYGDALNRLYHKGVVAKKRNKWQFVTSEEPITLPKRVPVIAMGTEPVRIAAKVSNKLFEFLEKLPDKSLLLRDEDGSLFVAEPVEEIVTYRTKTRTTMGKVGRE